MRDAPHEPKAAAFWRVGVGAATIRFIPACASAWHARLQTPRLCRECRRARSQRVRSKRVGGPRIGDCATHWREHVSIGRCQRYTHAPARARFDGAFSFGCCAGVPGACAGALPPDALGAAARRLTAAHVWFMRNKYRFLNPRPPPGLGYCQKRCRRQRGTAPKPPPPHVWRHGRMQTCQTNGAHPSIPRRRCAAARDAHCCDARTRAACKSTIPWPTAARRSQRHLPRCRHGRSRWLRTQWRRSAAATCHSPCSPCMRRTICYPHRWQPGGSARR